MSIGFFFNGFSNPHLVARAGPIQCKDPNMPLHGRLTLTGTNTEALVQWTTKDSEGGVVKWGKASGKYTETREARDMTYTRHEMCGGDAKHVRCSLPRLLSSFMGHAAATLHEQQQCPEATVCLAIF
jgi:hypothetical protein